MSTRQERQQEATDSDDRVGNCLWEENHPNRQWFADSVAANERAKTTNWKHR